LPEGVTSHGMPTERLSALLTSPLVASLLGLALALLLTMLARIGLRLAVARLTRVAERTGTAADDLVVDLLRRVSAAVVLAGSAALVAAWLPVGDAVRDLVRTAFVIACVYQAGVWGDAVIRFLLERRMAEARGAGGTATTLAALGFVIRLALWSALVLLGLQNLGVNVTALIAGLGIGGVAVALAVQNILGG